MQGSGFNVQGSGFRVQGVGFRVQGAGFRVGTSMKTRRASGAGSHDIPSASAHRPSIYSSVDLFRNVKSTFGENEKLVFPSGPVIQLG